MTVLTRSSAKAGVPFSWKQRADPSKAYASTVAVACCDEAKQPQLLEAKFGSARLAVYNRVKGYGTDVTV